MTEEKEILSRAETPQSGPQKTSTVTVQTGSTESRLGTVSIRAYVTLLVSLTACICTIFKIPMEEYFKSLCLMIIGFYFLQKKQ